MKTYTVVCDGVETHGLTLVEAMAMWRDGKYSNVDYYEETNESTEG